MDSVTVDKPRKFILISDRTDANVLESAINKILDDGCTVCVLWQPPNPFSPGYLPYPQIPLPEDSRGRGGD